MATTAAGWERYFYTNCLAFSLLVAFILPTEYESTAELMPPSQSGGSALWHVDFRRLQEKAEGGASRALAGLGSVLGQKTTGDLYIGVLSSRTVQDDLVNKFDLRRVYGKRRQVDARKKLDARTDMTVDKKSEIIKIAVTDKDPRRAAAMIREYIDDLNRLMTDLDTGSSHRERVFLEDRLAQVKVDLENAETSFSQFASKNVAVNVPEQSKAMLAASSQLEGQLIAAQTELQGLKQIYTDNNVRVRTTQARIDELQRQQQKLRGTSDPSDTSGGDSSTALQYPSVRKLSSLEVTYADLMRTSKVEEAVFEALTQQYEAAKVDEAKNLPIAKVLDQPEVPEKKSFPPRAIITIVGGLLILGFGMAWIVYAERWKNIDQHDPGKAFFMGVATDVAQVSAWMPFNSSSNGAGSHASEASASDNGHGPSQNANGDSDQ